MKQPRNSTHYRHFNVEELLLATNEYVLTHTVYIMLAMYLGLGLALDSKLPIQVSYGMASLPFIFIFLRFLSHGQKISFDGT